MGLTPPLPSLDSLSVLVRGFPRLKAKPVDTPARDSHIRQNNIIDSKTLANQLLCDQSVSPSLCPWRFPFPPQLRPSKTTNTSFWNAVKVPEVPLLSRPRRPRPKEEGKREVAAVAWPVLEAWRRFARWGSSETPSPTVSENETALSDMSDLKILISQFSILPYCVYFFQFPEAGGAPRGWITLCTVPMFWPPSPPWLCLTFSTPPTGSLLTWQLLFSGRWAHWFSSRFLCSLSHKNVQIQIRVTRNGS